MKCPECSTELRIPSRVDINRIGWICPNCNIKIYKEIDRCYYCGSCGSVIYKAEMGYCPKCGRDSLEVI